MQTLFSRRLLGCPARLSRTDLLLSFLQPLKINPLTIKVMSSLIFISHSFVNGLTKKTHLQALGLLYFTEGCISGSCFFPYSLLQLRPALTEAFRKITVHYYTIPLHSLQRKCSFCAKYPQTSIKAELEQKGLALTVFAGPKQLCVGLWALEEKQHLVPERPFSFSPSPSGQ